MGCTRQAAHARRVTHASLLASARRMRVYCSYDVTVRALGPFVIRHRSEWAREIFEEEELENRELSSSKPRLDGNSTAASV